MRSRIYQGSESEKIALEAMCQDRLRDAFWPYQEFLLSLRIPRTFINYLKDDAGNWLAFAMGRTLGDTVELFYIYVIEEARGRGLAQRILSEFEQYAYQEHDADFCTLEVRVSNSPAIRLYEAAGYKELGRRKGYYQDGEDAFVYSKELFAGETS